MNIQISCDDFEVSNIIKTLVHEKFTLKIAALLSHISADTPAYLRLNKDKYQHYSLNFEMSLPGKKIVAKATHPLLESAIIDLEQEVHKQISRYRDDQSPNSLG